jgi:hypothetical protein
VRAERARASAAHRRRQGPDRAGGSVHKLFDALPATIDKRDVLLPAGTHLSFADTCFGCDAALSEERGHELTNRYATAFLQVHLGGDARYAQYLDADPPDAVLVAPSDGVHSTSILPSGAMFPPT